MSILFASPNWSEYEQHFKNAFHKYKLDFNEITTNLQTDKSSVEYIIYSPVSELHDFSPFINVKAILNLWAGVEDIIKNPTLNKPLIRLVDDGMKQGMVEWCLAHVLRHHLGTDNHTKNQDGIWRSNVIPPLANEINIGVLGLGALGAAVAQSLAYIGFHVTGMSQTKKNLSNVKSVFGLDALNVVLKSSQILILLLPLTPKTSNLLNKKTLTILPKGAIIINPGRGALINEIDLLNSLNSGRVRHATLDVFSKEPLEASHPFWTHPKVTVTPHIAAHTRPRSSAETITRSIVKLRNGETPVGFVNREKFY